MEETKTPFHSQDEAGREPAYYAVIPANVRYDSRLRPSAKLLYGELTALCDKSGYCWARNKYFADLYGVCESTVASILRDLEKCGYIRREVIRDERGAVTERRIYAGTFNVRPSPRNLQEGSCRNLGDPPSEICRENNTSINNIPPIAPQGGEAADFDLFWQAYPKKVGKQAARKAFHRAKAPVESLLHAISEQKRSAQWSREGGRFIPNPATWLNQGRWEDELPSAAAPRAKREEADPWR